MPTSSSDRRRLLVIVIAAATVGLHAWMAGDLVVSRAADAGPGNLDALVRWWRFPFLLNVGALTALWLVVRRPADHRDSAFLTSSAIVIAVALVARVAVVLTHPPTLSDDIHRYVLDGRNVAHGVNPYHVRPEDRVHAPERWPGENDVAAHVNNPELHTIYLPTSQFAFGAAGVIVGDQSDPRRALDAFRFVFIGFELVAIGLLCVAVRRSRGSPWLVALYAWHPLAVIEIAGSGHQDAVGLPFLVGALLLAEVAPRHVGRFTVPLACAAMCKPFVIPLVALMLRGRWWCRWVWSGAIGALTCIALAAPFWWFDGGVALANLAATASRFTLKWAHFGPIYEPLLWIIERLTPTWSNDPQEQLARGVCLALFVGIAAIIFRRARDMWTGGQAMLLAMVLLSATAHPWYLLWALVLFPRARSFAVWTAAFTIPWGYAVLGDPVDWTISPWIMVGAWTPVAIALLIDLRRCFTQPPVRIERDDRCPTH